MNGIYLDLLRREIEDQVVNRYIDEICIKQKLLQIVLGKQALFVSLYSELPAVYLSKRVKIGFDKLEKFTNAISSSRIERLEQPDFMPVLKIVVERKRAANRVCAQLIISLYREAPNFIIKTTRTKKSLYSRYIEKKPKRSILDVLPQELEQVYKKQPSKFPTCLLKEFEGLDKNLAGELTPIRIVRLQKILECGKVKPRMVSVSPFKLSLFADEYLKEYDSLNLLFGDGVKQFLEAKTKESIAVRKASMIRNIERQLVRLQQKALSNEEIESYRIKGELILVNLTKIKKGAQHTCVRNPYDNKEIVITLDPQITAQANAQHCFLKYKKLKRGLPKIQERIKRLEQEITEIEDGFVKPSDLVKTQRGKDKKGEPFHTFELTSGAHVYAGKHARSNQELTFAFARPNDYFFHIRSYEGAHVILRAKIPRGQRPNSKDVNDAASIAAYFSKAKKQKNVPVSYTQRKYLKKNRKGKPGSVILMREDVVFVDPGLPLDRNV